MLLLDLDKLHEDTEEFKNAALNIMRETDVCNLLENLEAISSEIRDANKMYGPLLDGEKKANLFIAQILQLVQFWLISKEQFKMIDKIIDRSENLPMKFIGDEDEKEKGS